LCSFLNRLYAIVLIVRSSKAPWVHRYGRPAGTPRRAAPVVPHRGARRRRRSSSLPSPPPARDRRGSGRLRGARYFPLALDRSTYLRKLVNSFRNDFVGFFSILLFIPPPRERSRCSDPVAVMLECVLFCWVGGSGPTPPPCSYWSGSGCRPHPSPPPLGGGRAGGCGTFLGDETLLCRRAMQVVRRPRPTVLRIPAPEPPVFHLNGQGDTGDHPDWGASDLAASQTNNSA